MKPTVIIIGLLALLTSGCGPTVNTSYLLTQHYASKPSNYPIRMYSDQPPECKYEEMARVAVTGSVVYSVESLLESLRNEARDMGGDAIINFKIDTTRSTVGQPTPTEQMNRTVNRSDGMHLRGTVIRFTDPGCQK